MSFPCPVPACDRRATHWAICKTCAAALGHHLDLIPALLAEAEVTLARGAAAAGRGGSRAATPSLPFNPAASAVMGALRAALVGWVRVIVEDDGDPWPADDAAACAMWLGARVDRLRIHPAAVDITVEIAAGVAACWRAIDLPPERFFAGPCGECGAAMYARAGAVTVWCRAIGCRMTYDLAERRAFLLAAAAEELLTVADLMRVLPTWTGVALTDSTIRSWRRRGHLSPAGEGPTGRDLYRLGDVVAILAGRAS